ELGGKQPHLSILQHRDGAKLDAIRDTAESLNLEIATIAGYTDFTAGQSAPEVPLVEMQLEYVTLLAQMARRLGAKIVRVFSGYSPAEADFQADWRKCVDALRQAAGRAADEGVLLGLQNHHDIGITV